MTTATGRAPVDVSRAPLSVQRCVTHHACACHQWMADMWRSRDEAEALAAERRATVERIRERLLNEPTRDDGERTIGFITAILDEEAAP